MPELDWSDMPLHQSIKTDWKTPELLIEGSLNCAKTTLFLDKEIDAALKYPGIKSLLFRWSQDAVDTKLRPAFEEVLAIREIPVSWDGKKNRYTFENGSIVYCFGLKAVSLVEQMNKIRGLGVSRIAGDQVEEVAAAVGGELRGRLRPDLTATTVLKTTYPFQLTFVANPEDYDFWLSKEFPEHNRVKGRRMVSISVFDNKHLPSESIDSLLRQYPEDHPKHRSMVLGKRGPKVYGVAVFEGLYRKDLHWRPAEIRPNAPILEGFEYGKHNPVWIFGQAQHAGGLAILGGVMGLGLVLEDFLPIVERCKTAFYPHNAIVKTCESPMGGGQRAGARYTMRDVLRKIGRVTPVSRDNANAPDVRVAMIENIAGYMRRRNTIGQESFVVSNAEDRFLIASRDNPERLSPIVHHACEGGYTWDEHYVSVGSKELRQPREDDKFANVMHAIENIELNFCAGLATLSEREAQAADARAKAALAGISRARNGAHSWMG